MTSRQCLSRTARLAWRHAPRHQVRSVFSEAAAEGRSASYTYPVRSVCKATIIGRTGAFPRFYEFNDGGSSLTFTVATSEARVENGVRDPEPKTQWNRVVVADSVPGYEQILKGLEPGALVYVEGNMKVTKKPTEHGEYSEFVDVRVTRAQGTFRVLGRGQQAEIEENPF